MALLFLSVGSSLKICHNSFSSLPQPESQLLSLKEKVLGDSTQLLRSLFFSFFFSGDSFQFVPCSTGRFGSILRRTRASLAGYQRSPDGFCLKGGRSCAAGHVPCYSLRLENNSCGSTNYKLVLLVSWTRNRCFEPPAGDGHGTVLAFRFATLRPSTFPKGFP